MLVRFTFSVCVPVYGGERWNFSRNDRDENGKFFSMENLYTGIFAYVDGNF